MRGINLDYHQLFSRLNEKLSEENLQLHLHCVGGFVLEYYGMKATLETMRSCQIEITNA